MRAFKLTEQRLQPGCRQIQVEGELDLTVADLLGEALDHAADGNTDILIDLKRCEFLDSTGIAVIVSAHKRLSEQGRRIALHSASSQVLRVLSITGLTGTGLVFGSADEALSGGVSHPGGGGGLESS
jgi:anti-anti-sigma factor